MKLKRFAYLALIAFMLACNYVTSLALPPTATPPPTATLTATPTVTPEPLSPAYVHSVNLPESPARDDLTRNSAGSAHAADRRES